MKYILSIAPLLISAACAAKGEVSQAKFDAIADKCGLPRSAFQLREKDELTIEPPKNAKFESFDCALKEIKAANFPVKMGFVGNEVYKDEAK